MARENCATFYTIYSEQILKIKDKILKRYAYYLAGLVVLVLLGVYFNWLNDDPKATAPHTQTALERTGDECDLIAEKAAMALPEALPFQKLEKQARTARVLQTCMNDRGYVENPAWVKYAEPIVAKQAKAAQISNNEAYETLRRTEMKVFAASTSAPSYWIPAKP